MILNALSRLSYSINNFLVSKFDNLILFKRIDRFAISKNLIIPDLKKKERLKGYINQSSSFIISFTFANGGLTKNLYASYIIPNIICLSQEWAVQLVVQNDFEIENAFMATLGHEMSHSSNDFEQWCSFNKTINWCNEVYADFYSSKRMLNSSREHLILAHKFKAARKQNPNKSSHSHPSWNKRIHYVENYNFDETLIRQIAEDTGCKDEVLIKKLCDFYEPIILT